ncbi:hypothetical protein CGMCC3_g17860 [Colletotrichum fructicola]|nr:uncharacterized protein CGMCC3_g17860 [Colletotrichum fructicola]KAE9565957.1 hypothetical protein CGMCC3_g17860 [Colletotrichum fructicola]KAF4881401.1 hypothetical protein CGCFRS4_v015596 [Colletotrichum fructicola]
MAHQQFENRADPSTQCRELQSQVSTAFDHLNFVGGLETRSPEVTEGINQNIDANVFDKHNQSGILEVHASFVATKSNGKEAVELKIIWGGTDADNPPTGKTQMAHFGREIYLDGKRVAISGRVFSALDVILTYYRKNKRDQVDELSLRLSKNSSIKTGKMKSTTITSSFSKILT